MAKRIPENELQEIEDIVRRHPDGIIAQQIAAALTVKIPNRTLQYRLKYLVDNGRLEKQGKARWARYLPPAHAALDAQRRREAAQEEEKEAVVSLSDGGAEVQAYVRQRPEKRKPVGYDRAFLDSYRPNVTPYLSETEKVRLIQVGRPESGEQPAGTYAKQIMNRLLIDLSWNSSRLEGNTYSLLDTKRLIDFGEEAAGKQRLEAQMILNHKDAIEFLVGTAGEIGFNRYTILNLHAMLANNLLPDEAAVGRLRRMPVGIERSAFHPLEVPQLIEECFDQILAKAAAIEDPIEQTFFVMVQLPYLQPFDDVNKRVSRLAANIPLIRANLCPLSFTDVPRSLYNDAMLGVYELNRIDLLKDVFIWAYERSAARYAAVRQSLGEPDPFKMKYRGELRDLVRVIVGERMTRKEASSFIQSWINDHIGGGDREHFRETAENELLSLHEGNFARYRILPSEFQAWQDVWNPVAPALTDHT